MYNVKRGVCYDTGMRETKNINSFWIAFQKLLIFLLFLDTLTLITEKGGMIMVIQRKEYLDKLIAFKDKQLIKVVTGIRRCGKFTLLEIYQNWLLE